MRAHASGRKQGTLAKLAELSIAVPQVVALRTAQMAKAGNTPNARDTAEFSRMGAEKVAAFGESLFAMGRQTLRIQQEYTSAVVMRLVRMWMTPWWLTAFRPVARKSGALPTPQNVFVPTQRQQQRATSRLIASGLAPVHRRATANAKRLMAEATKPARKRASPHVKRAAAKAAAPVAKRTSGAKRRVAAKKRSRS